MALLVCELFFFPKLCIPRNVKFFSISLLKELFTSANLSVNLNNFLSVLMMTTSPQVGQSRIQRLNSKSLQLSAHCVIDILLQRR